MKPYNLVLENNKDEDDSAADLITKFYETDHALEPSSD